MSRHGTYDMKFGFIPDDDCPQTYLCDSCSLYPCGESGVKMERRCPAYNPIPKPQTNADRIRAMTDEELAKWMAGRKEACPPRKEYKCSKMTCAECWLDWLREEANDGNS